jgi:hypothetical protein
MRIKMQVYPVLIKKSSFYRIKYNTRMDAVESAPAAAIRRVFGSFTRIQAAIQKKMYGIRVVITEIMASASKRLETKRRRPLAPHPMTSAFTGVPRRLKSLIFGMENRSERVWRIREVAMI